MSLPSRRRLVVAAALTSGLLAFATPSAATVGSRGSTTYRGAFEFDSLAAVKTSKGCRGEGAFGVMKPGARVRLSERVASGDFQALGKGKIGKGKIGKGRSDGNGVCRMRFKVNTTRGPAADSRVYLEVQGVTFDISWPAADVADGDLGTWSCEYSDTTCAVVVGRD
jgi:hypothetical protein